MLIFCKRHLPNLSIFNFPRIHPVKLMTQKFEIMHTVFQFLDFSWSLVLLFLHIQICFNSFFSLSYQLRFVWKISAIKCEWRRDSALVVLDYYTVKQWEQWTSAIVIHSENTNLRSKGSSRLHVGMLFSLDFNAIKLYQILRCHIIKKICKQNFDINNNFT